MSKHEYGYYQCRKCKGYKRAWIESECYQREMCPKCIDGELELDREVDNGS